MQIPNTFHERRFTRARGCVDPQLRRPRHLAGIAAATSSRSTYQRNYKWKGHEISLGGQEGLPINADVASTKRDPVLYYIGQAKWTSTISNKLLFETGYSVDILHYSNYYQDGIREARGTPAWYAKASHLNTPAGGTLERTNAGQLEQCSRRTCTPPRPRCPTSPARTTSKSACCGASAPTATSPP